MKSAQSLITRVDIENWLDVKLLRGLCVDVEVQLPSNFSNGSKQHVSGDRARIIASAWVVPSVYADSVLDVPLIMLRERTLLGRSQLRPLVSVPASRPHPSISHFPFCIECCGV